MPESKSYAILPRMKTSTLKTNKLYPLDEPLTTLLPVFSSKISAGFPSPADDYIEGKIDLNRLLVKNHPSTYMVKVDGNSMIGAGILSGDILIIDTSIQVTDKKIVVACINGELLIKRYSVEKGQIYLKAENPDFNPILIDPNDDFSIIGAVTSVIRQLIK